MASGGSTGPRDGASYLDILVEVFPLQIARGMVEQGRCLCQPP